MAQGRPEMNLARSAAHGLLVLVAGCCAFAQSGNQQYEKRWDFHGGAGAVEIRLTSYLNERGLRYANLELYSLNGATLSTAEEAQFLSTVLDDIPQTGIKFESLGWISFRSSEPDAVATVASFAALSPKWRPAVKSRSTPAVYSLVTAFLNDSGAYQDWDRVFRLHGFTVKVVGVEKVILQPFPQTQARCPPLADCAHLLVPVDALVQMNIYPASHP
jgi:hypothetical protein